MLPLAQHAFAADAFCSFITGHTEWETFDAFAMPPNRFCILLRIGGCEFSFKLVIIFASNPLGLIAAISRPQVD
jgi:hypothetical protein